MISLYHTDFKGPSITPPLHFTSGALWGYQTRGNHMAYTTLMVRAAVEECNQINTAIKPGHVPGHQLSNNVRQETIRVIHIVLAGFKRTFLDSGAFCIDHSGKEDDHQPHQAPQGHVKHTLDFSEKHVEPLAGAHSPCGHFEPAKMKSLTIQYGAATLNSCSVAANVMC